MTKGIVYVAKDFTSGLTDVKCKLYHYRLGLIKTYNMHEIVDTGVYYCYARYKRYGQKNLVAIIDSETKPWKVCKDL